MSESRDKTVIEHILRYCEQVQTAHQDFECSKKRFFQSTTYQNAVCMCILQIGELIGRLSEDFRTDHGEIPWHKIRGMRNFVAHEYGKLDLEIVWFAATKSIPELKQFCSRWLDAKKKP